MSRKAISDEALLDLRRQLGALPPRSSERRRLIQEASTFYGVSEPTLYRLLRQRRQPRTIGRSDRGAPRVLPQPELERYLELIAALKVRTSNHKGRHLSTAEAIRLLEDYGLDTPEGRVQAPKCKGLIISDTGTDNIAFREPTIIDNIRGAQPECGPKRMLSGCCQ